MWTVEPSPSSPSLNLSHRARLGLNKKIKGKFIESNGNVKPLSSLIRCKRQTQHTATSAQLLIVIPYVHLATAASTIQRE